MIRDLNAKSTHLKHRAGRCPRRSNMPQSSSQASEALTAIEEPSKHGTQGRALQLQVMAVALVALWWLNTQFRHAIVTPQPDCVSTLI